MSEEHVEPDAYKLGRLVETDREKVDDWLKGLPQHADIELEPLFSAKTITGEIQQRIDELSNEIDELEKETIEGTGLDATDIHQVRKELVERINELKDLREVFQSDD